ncbi:MAG: LptE family protein [Candidatus Schekmanbacteria bacterium]|nr:LptE family protein [Candidatus Schekmanbacteria bacterium]
MKTLTAKLILLFCIVTLTSCGYRLVRSSLSVIPDDFKTISIPLFKNETGEPNLEKQVTEAVVQKFISIGRLKVTSDQEKADAVLEGAITRYTPNIPLSFAGSSNIREYRVEITGRLILKEAATGRVIRQLDNLYSKREYMVDDKLMVTREHELEAKKLAAFEFARDLAMALENF